MTKRKKNRSNAKGGLPAHDAGTNADGSSPKAGSPSAAKRKGPKKKTEARRGPEMPGVTFPIVGIGASAGGIEAFIQMLRGLPADTGMAFVFVQHLHPDYESALTEILARETPMPVTEAADGMQVEPDHIYVIPPDSYLGILRGTLQLLPRPGANERRLPIDQFLRYLAEDHGARAIGIILSGTASDGVLGLKAVKAEGGITFAQDEASAKYNGMPHSAIASGAVDFVLAPERIAVELERIAHHPYVVQERAGKAPEVLPTGGDNLDKIFMLMRRHSGHDFTYYKHTTIQRRIRRRMLLHKLERLEDYLRYLQEHDAELDLLFQDILINVTGFFRDPEVFDALAVNVFPAITPGKSPDHPVRIWVPGCSTGEEAYSIAIALLEYLGERAATTPVQIFATDIDEIAINKAREGIYPENIVQDVTVERLRRFFTQHDGGYRISKSIRDICVFAVQNVTKDPPFSRLDMISCRNLLIYLGPVLQKRVMRVFHYALNTDGFLLLGTAESVGEHGDLFRSVDSRNNIYAAKPASLPVQVDFGIPAAVPPAPTANDGRHGGGPVASAGPVDIEKEADRLLMSRYVPAGVVINEHMEILLFRGRTGPYLEPAPGEASLNLLKMAREDLTVPLNTAVREAIASRAAAGRRDVHLHVNGDLRHLDIEVTPLSAPDSKAHFLVVFRETAPPAKQEKETAKGKPGDSRDQKSGKDGEVERLKHELASTKEYLQSVIEQQETNNEELRSANEEIQSSNEELQSINEELETAKEELQSTNEELATVNDELESRNRDLTRANNDLTNLIASMDIPIVIVGVDLRIRRFTPRAETLLNLIDTDVGRPISDIKPNIDVPGFQEMLTAAIDDVETRQQDARDNQGRWYSVRVRPYKTQENRIDGAVIAFVDVDALAQSLEETRAARDYAEAIVAAVRQPMLVLDRNLRVISASDSYLETFQVTEEETVENLVYRLGNGQWAIPELRKHLNGVVKEGRALDKFEVTHDFERIGTRSFKLSARRIRASRDDGPVVLMQLEDASDGDPHEGSRA